MCSLLQTGPSITMRASTYIPTFREGKLAVSQYHKSGISHQQSGNSIEQFKQGSHYTTGRPVESSNPKLFSVQLPKLSLRPNLINWGSASESHQDVLYHRFLKILLVLHSKARLSHPWESRVFEKGHDSIKSSYFSILIALEQTAVEPFWVYYVVTKQSTGKDYHNFANEMHRCVQAAWPGV